MSLVKSLPNPFTIATAGGPARWCSATTGEASLMADIVHARDGLPSGAAARPKPSAKQDAQGTARMDKPPRSDVGTIVLHWTTAIAFVVSLLTGIRMATFGWVLPSL